MNRFLFTLIISVIFCFSSDAIETKATQVLLKDLSTGTILFEKNADDLMPTSSMSKVMTMYVVFDRLKNGDIFLNDKFKISKKAWKKQGSKTFVKVGDEVLVEDLIKGTIIQSGNDASIALAEGIAGSEEAFAELLNEKSAELGMKNSHFVNATGWPDENHYSTSRDLALLAEYMVTDFPEYYNYYSEKEFTYNNIRQMNRNPLLYHNIGADGIKTGQTESAGFGIMGAAIQNDRRLILVMNGLNSMKDRSQESLKLMEWGFREFKNITIAEADEPKATVNIKYAKKAEVEIAPKEAVKLTVMKRYQNKVQTTIVIDERLTAPISTSDSVGKLIVTAPEMSPFEVALYPIEDVARMNIFMRLWINIKLFFVGFIG